MTTNPPITAADRLLSRPFERPLDPSLDRATPAPRAAPQAAPHADEVERQCSARRLSDAALDAIAELAVLTDNTDEATLESACRQAIAQDPCHVESFARLTTLLCRQGRHDEALELIDQAVGWCGDIAALYHFAGCVLESAGRLPQAIASFEQALDLNPALAESHYRLGALCERLGEPRASAAHFRVYRRLVDENRSNQRLS